jgi:hypothetical protein
MYGGYIYPALSGGFFFIGFTEKQFAYAVFTWTKRQQKKESSQID